MPMRKRPLLPLLLLLGWSLARPSTSEACSCGELGLEAAARQAPAVYEVEITATHVEAADTPDCKNSQATCVRSRWYEAKVKRVWKGTVPARVKLLGGPDNAMCGASPLTGKRWIMFGVVNDDAEHKLHLCDHHLRYRGKDAARLTKLLGKPKPPVRS